MKFYDKSFLFWGPSFSNLSFTIQKGSMMNSFFNLYLEVQEATWNGYRSVDTAVTKCSSNENRIVT